MLRWWQVCLLATIFLHSTRADQTDGNSEAINENEFKRLMRLKNAISLEEQAVSVLERFDQYRGWNSRKQSFALFAQDLGEGRNSSDGKIWVNREKVVRDCNFDAFEMTKNNPRGFCELAESECKSSGSINYLALPFCMLPNYSWLAVLILIAWLVVLVLWLSTTVDFICPNLVTVTHVLGIGDSVAGITLLAIGNGSSDIFSMVSAALSGPKGLEMAVGEVLGNGMFVFCVVQGFVALMASFTVSRAEYLRDCGTYLLGLLLTFLFLMDGEVALWEGFALVLLYLVYIAVVINFAALRRMVGVADDEADAATSAAKEDKAGSAPLIPKDGGAGGGGDHPSARSGAALSVYCFDESAAPAYAQLAERVFAVDRERWAAASWPERVVEALRMPALVLQNLTVPVVDRDIPNHNWNRPMAMVHAFLLPLVTLALADRAGLWAGGDAADEGDGSWGPAGVRGVLYGAAAATGACLSLAVYLTSRSSYPPSYYPYAGFLGFLVSMQWIYFVADEIVSLILDVGIACHFDKVLLGATLLAVGVGLQDLVTNLGITRAGHPNMAAAACIGSPILNLLLGLGVASVAGNTLVSSPYPFFRSVHILVYLAFLLSTIVAGAVLMVTAGFRAGPSLAALLLGMYLAFVLSVVTLAAFNDQVTAAAGRAFSGAFIH